MTRTAIIVIGAILGWLALAHLFTAFAHWHWYWVGEWHDISRAGVFALAFPMVAAALFADAIHQGRL